MSFASLCVFTYTHPVSFLSKCDRKEPQRSSCGSNILPQRSSCAFIMQPQRSSCGFQNSSSSSSDPQSAARRTSSCGRKKKFLRVHYFWAVLYMYISLLILMFLNRCISVKTSLIYTKLGNPVNLGVLFLTH